LLNEFNLAHDAFTNFVCSHKDRVGSLPALLSLANEEDIDSEEIVLCKRVFKEISIIFLRYYATNWIYNSAKLKNRDILLKNRLLLQRRIKNPKANVRILRNYRKSANK